jgi:hypothetical protein
MYHKLRAKLDSAATWNEPHDEATPHKLYSSSSTGTQHQLEVIPNTLEWAYN